MNPLECDTFSDENFLNAILCMIESAKYNIKFIRNKQIIRAKAKVKGIYSSEKILGNYLNLGFDIGSFFEGEKEIKLISIPENNLFMIDSLQTTLSEIRRILSIIRQYKSRFFDKIEEECYAMDRMIDEYRLRDVVNFDLN